MAARQSSRTIALLQDLSGPKIRTGLLRGHTPLQLEIGDALTIVVGDAPGEPGRVSTTFDLPSVVHPGDCLLLDDGRLQLRVVEVGKGELRTRVVDGGPLGEHKGINVPGVEFPTKGLTEKDIDDLRFGASAGRGLRCAELRAERGRSASGTRTASRGGRARYAARREARAARSRRPPRGNPAGERCRDGGARRPRTRAAARACAAHSEGSQRRWARALEVPVIVATQVFESMRTEPRPTRAEVSDAANAVDDGVDAIMLAGETAAGAYPVKAVQTLDVVIREAESMPPIRRQGDQARLIGGHAHAVCEAAVTLAERGDAAAIVAVTRGGKTARVLSALRPRAPIYAATDEANVSRRLALSWGVVPVLTDLTGDVNVAASRIGGELVTRGAIERRRRDRPRQRDRRSVAGSVELPEAAASLTTAYQLPATSYHLAHARIHTQPDH